MKLKFWERKGKKVTVTYRAEIPEGSNGWADVIGSNGDRVCTCYVNGRIRAKLVVNALNAYVRRHV